MPMNLKLQHSHSLDNPQAVEHFQYLGNGEFEPCLAGVGNLNCKCQVFPVENKCYQYLLIWQCLMVKSSFSWVFGSNEKLYKILFSKLGRFKCLGSCQGLQNDQCMICIWINTSVLLTSRTTDNTDCLHFEVMTGAQLLFITYSNHQ